MEPNIILTKLIVPKPRKNYIARLALFQQLDAIKEKRLTVVKGMPGSGKTTLLTSYFSEEKLTPLWVSLDRECDNVMYFWSYAVKALSGYLYTSEPDPTACLQSGAGFDIKGLIRALINSLNSAEDVYLVLDDFHLVHDTDLLESFSYFLDNIPPAVHVILLCREKPLLYLAKYEMQDELLYIEESMLRLTEEESIAFLRKTLSSGESEEVLLQLIRKAEGWIGGLQLLAAALPKGKVALDHTGQSTEHNLSLPEMKTINLSLMHDYIAGEIFSKLELYQQEFLVVTALPAYFNKRVCERALPNVDHDALLKQLLEKNLMIQSVDEERGLYQYHSLLRDFLLTRFNGLSANLKQDLSHKISDVFFEERDYEEGLRLLYLQNDYDRLMKRVLEVPPGALQFAYMEKMPVSQAAADFDFAFQKFFYHYYMYDYDVCLALHDAAAAKIGKDDRFMAFDGIKVLFDQESYEYGRESVFKTDAKQIYKMAALPLTKALILMKESALLFYQDQYKEALHFIEQSAELVKDLTGTYVHYFNLTMKSQICEEMGLLNKALTAQEQIHKLFERNKLLQELHTPTFCVTVAGFYLKQMRLFEADKILESCAAAIEQRGGQLRHSYEYNRIEYLFLSGSGDEGMRALMDLMATDAYSDIMMVASLLKYPFRSGNITAQLQDRFLLRYESIDNEARTLNGRLLYARILCAKGQEEKALAVLDEALGLGRKQASGLKIAEANLQKLSVLLKRSKDVRRLVDLYKEAVYYASENRICMPFFLEADAVTSLHRQHGDRILAVLTKPEKSFHEEILRLCTTKENSILSDREQEVLQAIADGLSNPGIADRLCISLPTVKTHISNIFRKLEVKGRVAALEKARQAGLIG